MPGTYLNSLVALPKSKGGKIMEPHKMTVNEIKPTDIWPDGEIRPTRKKWPKESSPVFVVIAYEGSVFTVAKARILVGKHGTLIEAEGISRLSPTDDPDNNNPIQGKEMAISQAVRALYTRVTKHRRSYHHYRG